MRAHQNNWVHVRAREVFETVIVISMPVTLTESVLFKYNLVIILCYVVREFLSFLIL